MRKSAQDLRERLDLSSGDRKAKRSAFWTMLVLSGLIAAAGVSIDSTATVIGAMIIAPLSTPIFGIAFGVVSGELGLVARSLRVVLAGAVAVVGIGILTVLVSRDNTTIATSSQVLDRTSPTLGDLLAAVATGLAGSFALIRKDLGDALPGIAVAISLVPPLVVVGVCLGTGSPFEALGALILFLSNVAALIAAGTVVLSLTGYRGQLRHASRRYLAVAAFLVAVAVPISLNSATLILLNKWKGVTRAAATEWIADIPGSDVESAEWEGRTIIVTIRSPEELPPKGELEQAVREGGVPSEVRLSVIHNLGIRLD